jgi:hypothetical protein
MSSLSPKGESRVPTILFNSWMASIIAVKSSENFPEFEAFFHQLPDSLPQNAPVTRRKASNYIAKCYFPAKTLLDLPAYVWRIYHRDNVLLDIMRVMTLDAEPIIARFITNHVLVLSPGDPFDTASARDFITSTYGGFKQDSYYRLLIAAQELGFVTHQGKTWFTQAIPRPDNALLILLHARLAPTPRIVRLSDILAATFWQYLGLRSPDDVRAILRDAQAANLIARYAVVDELDQITTRYTVDEYLAKGLLL